MHFIDRWMLSMVVGAITLLVLILVMGIPHHFWIDALHMWCTMAGINQLRLTLFKQ